MSELYEKLRPHIERQFALDCALTLYSWDNETLAPKDRVDNLENDMVFMKTVVSSLADRLSKLEKAQ